MKHILMLVAATLVSAQPLHAQGLPEFGDIPVNTVDSIPAIPAPVPEPVLVDEVTSPNYVFGLNINTNGALTDINTQAGDFKVRIIRVSYGNYLVEMEIDYSTASLNIYRPSAGQYVLRGDEVNLTAVSGRSGDYNISGDIPTPVVETLSMRLDHDLFGKFAVVGNGYNLKIKSRKITGNINQELFSKADAACVIALAVTIKRDKQDQNSNWDPNPTWDPNTTWDYSHWHPYDPYWHHVYYTPIPGVYNPWHDSYHGGHSGGHPGGNPGGNHDN